MPSGAQAREAKFTLLFTNDHHGQVEALSDGSSGPSGGVSRRRTLIERIREEVGPKNVLLVDGGDIFTGTALSGLSHGKVDCEAYKLMGYDAVALGNHDFDYGKGRVLEYRREFGMPWISANVLSRGHQPFLRPYVVRYSGVRVGFIGMSHPDTPSLTKRENVQGLVFNPPGASMKGLYSILKKDVDIFVVLSHLGVEGDRKFAENNDFVHVIVGGHSHTLLKQPIVERRADGSTVKPIIVQAGSKGQYLGRLDLTVKGRMDPKTRVSDYIVTDFQHRLLPVDDDLPPDPKMEELLDRYRGETSGNSLDEVLLELPSRFDRNYGGDSLLGKLATDVLREAAEADAALMNSGSFRSDHDSRNLTRKDLFRIYPFDDEVAVFEMTGDTLRDILERSMEKRGGGAFLQVSGLEVRMDGGSLRVEVAGEPLEGRRKYRVAVNDFLAQGGDGYSVFRKLRGQTKTGSKIRDLLEERFKALGRVSSSELKKRWYLP